MNVENMNKLIDLLEGLQDGRFQMEKFIGYAIDEAACRISDRTAEQVRREDPKALQSCGTAACIAGWAASLADPFGKKVETQHLEDTARQWLGLSLRQADRLFYGEWDTLEDPDRKRNLPALSRQEAIVELRELVAQEKPVV